MQSHIAAHGNERGFAAGRDLPCPSAGALARLTKSAVFLVHANDGRCAFVDLGRCIHDFKDTFCAGKGRENGVDLL